MLIFSYIIDIFMTKEIRLLYLDKIFANQQCFSSISSFFLLLCSLENCNDMPELQQYFFFLQRKRIHFNFVRRTATYTIRKGKLFGQEQIPASICFPQQHCPESLFLQLKQACHLEQVDSAIVFRLPPFNTFQE